jgi:hypothetical protein
MNITIEDLQDFIDYSAYIDNMFVKRNKRNEMNVDP